MQKKMTRQERAKIFAPFDALKGFKEALKEEEVIKVTKVSLSEDQKDELDKILRQLKVGMMIEVIHYDLLEKSYIKTIGVFTKIDTINKCIFVVKNKLLIDDIIDIKIISVSLDF